MIKVSYQGHCPLTILIQDTTRQAIDDSLDTSCMVMHSGRKRGRDGQKHHYQRFPLVRTKSGSTSLDCTPEEMRREDILG
jgi:hypothetical protein